MFVAFDIEITAGVHGPDWSIFRPYGISCAATKVDDEPVKVWHGDGDKLTLPGITHPERMTPGQVAELASYLLSMTHCGHRVVTWNGLGFDFDVLAEESRNPKLAREICELALNHIDLGFLMRCQLGFMAKLVKVAQGLDVGNKTEGMHGGLAPVLWTGNWPDIQDEQDLAELRAQVQALALAQGAGFMPGNRMAQDLVCEYVGQDVILTMDVCQALIQRRSVNWITGKGTPSQRPWRPTMAKTGMGPRPLLARECLAKVQEPNTSWMTNAPKPRESYYEWMKPHLGTYNLAMALTGQPLAD